MALLRDLLFGTSQPQTRRTEAAPGAPSAPQLALGRQIYQYFVERGLPSHQAAAIAGNMAWEGGGRVDLVNPNDNPRGSPNSPHSAGIAQWNDRLPGLLAYARTQGIDIPEGNLRDSSYVRSVISRVPLNVQLGYAWQEMQGPEGRAFSGITGGTDLRTATAGAIGYHRPAGWTRANPEAGHGFENRLSIADVIMNGPRPDGDAPPATRGVAPPVGTATTPPPGGTTPATPRGLLTGLVEGTPFEGVGGLLSQPQAPAAQQAAPVDLADQVRRRADAIVNPAQDEGSGIQGIQLPQLDLTRLRALMQRRGMLGSA